MTVSAAPAASERAAAADRVLHVEECMGTVFTIDIRDPGRWESAIDEVVAWLRHVDRVFSTYRHDSDIVRINRGVIRLRDADPLVGEVLGLCADLQTETEGYFTARRDSSLDPTGLVKGWAIERASDLLRGRGSGNHVINGGGDMQIAGEQAGGQPWEIGVVDPSDAAALLTLVPLRDGAIATSGTAERGRHIRDPHSGRPCDTFASVTVVGSSLTRVDAFATAAVAMGPGAVAWLDSKPGYEALAVYPTGRVARTHGWDSLLRVAHAEP